MDSQPVDKKETSVPRPVPMPLAKSDRTPHQLPIGKIRDSLTIQGRLTSIERNPRGSVQTAVINPAVYASICENYVPLFHSYWNQGFSQLEQSQPAQAEQKIEIYAKNYLHSFLIDLYSSVRRSVSSKDIPTFIDHFDEDIGTTGNRYDSFLTALFPMLHPVQQSGSLEESLHIWTFDLDKTRPHDNWFNIPNVRAGDLTFSRQRGVISVLERAKDIELYSPPIGTSLGCGSTLLDFYPLAAPTMAVSWLNQDNNYPDTNLVIMFIINTSFSELKLGPRYTTLIFPTPQLRDQEEPPFPSGVIEIEDTTHPNWLHAYHVGVNKERVDTYAAAREQQVEVINGYSRTFWYYRKVVIDHSDPFIRLNSFKQLVIHH
jgi:hypothetical protein